MSSPAPVNPYESPRVDPFAPGDLEEPVLAEEANSQQPPGEQIGVLYGSLFIFGLAITAWFNPELQQAIATRYFWFGMWPSFANIVQDAFGLAGLGLLVVRKVQGKPTFPRLFGHWLLLLHGVSFLTDTFYIGLYNHLLRDQWEDPDIDRLSLNVQESLKPLLVLLILLTMGIAALAIRYSPQEKMWRRYALFNIGIHAWHMVATLGGSSNTFAAAQWNLAAINMLLVGLSVLCFLIAVARDWRLAAEKDQLHWVGVGCQAAFLAILLWSVYVGATQDYSGGF